jgi:hypothetical protein
MSNLKNKVLIITDNFGNHYKTNYDYVSENLDKNIAYSNYISELME